MKKLRNRKGVIALVTMLILAAVGILGISMAITSQVNSSAANNYRHKIQTFNAADGLMTLLAQDMLDFQDSKYMNGRPHVNIGNPPTSGGYGYDMAMGIDTLIGSGSLHVGPKDSCHFSYCEMKGNMELIVKFAQHQPGDRGKAGIMVRQDLTPESKYVLLAYVDRTTTFDTVRLQSRRSLGADSKERADSAHVALPLYLRLNRVDSVFDAYYSPSGESWTPLGKDTVNFTDPVRIGLAIASGAASEDIAVFTNSEGIPFGVLIDTIKIGADSIPAVYNIYKMSQDIFNMEVEAYKETGGSNAHNYETRLTQGLGRESSGSWHSLAKDSAKVPVTFYDFRADCSNPEFNVKSFVVSFWPVFEFKIAHFVQNTLDPDRKPVLKPDTYGFRTCFLNLFDPDWYNLDKCARIQKMNIAANGANAWKMGNCITTCSNQFSWNFSDSLRRWFRPSGGTGATFDTATGKWNNLKQRPKYKPGSGWTEVVEDEWVGQDYDSADQFANIVVYDTLTFREIATNPGMFQFGDSINLWVKNLDKDFFSMGQPGVKCSCNAACKSGKTVCASDTETGVLRPSDWKFMPLKGKGFGYCGTRYIYPKKNVFADDENFAFTMEIHRKFTYKPGQTFVFRGDDDVWVFINNQLEIDLGGVHGALKDSVNLDDLGLTVGNEYDFDMFYCERCVETSNILITTNMMFWLPPQPLKRNWKRDYGNLD